MLRIARSSSYNDKLRVYKVELDDVVIGNIADGEIKEFSVTPGNHALRLKIDWCSSPKLEFEQYEKQINKFKCGTNLKGRNAWFAIFYILFLPHKYIALEHSN